MSYRANPTNREQDVLEEAEFAGGVPVRMNEAVRVIRKGNGGGSERFIAGVVVPPSDRIGVFASDTIGRP